MALQDMVTGAGGKDTTQGFRRGLAIFATGWLLTLLSATTLAQHEGKSSDEVAKELSNPAGSLASIVMNLNYNSYKGDLPGADSQHSWSFSTQPVLPWPVGDKGRQIIFRPLVTLPFDQPVFDADQGRFKGTGLELEDISFQLAYAGNEMKDEHNGLLWGIGAAGTLPTATDDRLAGDQWRLGPALFGGVVRKWGLLGLILENQWNIGGSNGEDYSVLSGQYFYALGMGNGWQIASGPNFAYDWKADNDEAFTFPVGIGVAKTTKFGAMPVKLQAQVQYYVEQPDAFGPQWLLKFTVTPVVKNPFVFK